MGTKQLMADKRVAEVTLNDAGKAATLTLAAGWTYEGSQGPFELKNVEHGHQIVRGATNPAGSTRAPRAKKPPEPYKEGIAPTPTVRDPAKPYVPPTPRTDISIVYRILLVATDPEDKSQREIGGWLQVTEPLTKERLAERTWEMLKTHATVHGTKVATAKTHKVASFRWTNKHQANARKDGTMGAPWSGLNFGEKE